ncbi:MAG TPA: LysR family transcriptional regulator [Stellaceae bacterium]|nr:LysR family transcriptional regulator [Stellaceae bacterium]
MFLRQLEYLVALSQEQHFSRAAQRCNVSQPSLSNAIKQLEGELGTPIVLRHQRFQGFTSEGVRIVEWSKRMLADRNAMLQELSVLKKNLSGHLRLGAMPTSSPILPFITRQFLQLHPGVQIQVSFLGLEEMRVKLTNFDLDVGITYIDQMQPPPLISMPLYKEHLSLLVPHGSRFAAAGSMSWAEAADIPLCLLPPNMHERQIIDSAFASVGKAPIPQIESDSIVNLAFHTMHGGVVTIIPSHFFHVIGAFPGTHIVRLVEPEVVREVGLIWVGGDPILPMAKAMLNLLKSFAASGELARRLGEKAAGLAPA